MVVVTFSRHSSSQLLRLNQCKTRIQRAIGFLTRQAQQGPRPRKASQQHSDMRRSHLRRPQRRHTLTVTRRRSEQGSSSTARQQRRTTTIRHPKSIRMQRSLRVPRQVVHRWKLQAVRRLISHLGRHIVDHLRHRPQQRSVRRALRL